MTLRKIIVGSTGFSHLLHTLEYGNELCRCLSAALRGQEASCTIFALLPEGVGIPEDGNFRTSMGGVSNYLPQYLQDFLQKTDGEGSVIFDDVMASKGDVYLATAKTVFNLNDEIYHCIDVTSSIQVIDELVWATAVSWHFLCVCMNTSMPSIVSNGKYDADAIGEHWKEIIVGAFDGEGFIHCSRNTR